MRSVWCDKSPSRWLVSSMSEVERRSHTKWITSLNFMTRSSTVLRTLEPFDWTLAMRKDDTRCFSAELFCEVFLSLILHDPTIRNDDISLNKSNVAGWSITSVKTRVIGLWTQNVSKLLTSLPKSSTLWRWSLESFGNSGNNSASTDRSKLPIALSAMYGRGCCIWSDSTCWPTLVELRRRWVNCITSPNLKWARSDGMASAKMTTLWYLQLRLRLSQLLQVEAHWSNAA